MAENTFFSRQRVEDLIREFIATSPDNTMNDGTGESAWEEVLIGFASGADPIWQEYKEYVGPFHWTPWEIYSQNHPQIPARAQDLTVISWVLPQRKAVRRSNRVKSARFSYASSWSERHVAHACGLGTFGLCDGLITAKGKAMRAGSVVAHIPIEPTPRLYSHHRAYCLFFAQGACGKCIERCPAGAITDTGHDKEKCRQHLARTREYVQDTYNFKGYGCGLCQVGVPCEAGIPVKAAREALEKGELPPPPPPLA
ncbi:MAG: 4Fe-4S ferredoxin [Desulfovermiculus sp.]|nr:4Fe-4S ferredoxin [Desulfovermiculus sp.]